MLDVSARTSTLEELTSTEGVKVSEGSQAPPPTALTFHPKIVRGPPPTLHLLRAVGPALTFESVVVRGLGGEEHVREQPLERVPLVARTVLHVVANGGLEAVHELGGRSAELLCGRKGGERRPKRDPGPEGGTNERTTPTDDLVPLVDVVRAREEDAAANHLAHDAAHRPDVHVVRVPHAQDHLRGKRRLNGGPIGLRSWPDPFRGARTLSDIEQTVKAAPIAPVGRERDPDTPRGLCSIW